MKIHKRLLSQPVFRLLIIALLMASLLPIFFLSINIYRQAWQQEWDNVKDQHQLLAANTAEPIKQYVNFHRESLKILQENATFNSSNELNIASVQHPVITMTRYFNGFRRVSLVTKDGKTLFSTSKKDPQSRQLTNRYASNPCFLNTKKFNANRLCPVKPSLMEWSPLP